MGVEQRTMIGKRIRDTATNDVGSLVGMKGGYYVVDWDGDRVQSLVNLKERERWSVGSPEPGAAP